MQMIFQSLCHDHFSRLWNQNLDLFLRKNLAILVNPLVETEFLKCDPSPPVVGNLTLQQGGVYLRREMVTTVTNFCSPGGYVKFTANLDDVILLP